MSDWSQLMQNPKATVLKKFLAQIIPDKLHTYDDLMTRLGATLVTDSDIRIFADLLNDVLVSGYLRALEDYRNEFKRLGLNTSLSLPNQKN